MKAMVFAAGVGSRLKDLTKNTPKCLIDIGSGATMLGHVLTKLKKSGITSVIINLHHLPDAITNYLSENDFGIDVAFSEEPELLGTGGGLKKAAWFFNTDEPFIVHNSDVFSDIDLKALCSHHESSGALGTLAVMTRPTRRHLLFDETSSLIGWENSGAPATMVRESPAPRRAAFSGIQILNPRVFDYFKAHHGEFSIISAYLSAVEAGEKLESFDMSSSYWIDMGTPENLDELRKKVKS